MKILIGYDGSESSDMMLADLKRAGLPLHAEATVITVADVWMPPSPPSENSPAPIAADVQISDAAEKASRRAAEALKEVVALAESARKRIESSFPEWTVASEACIGSPAWEIIKRSDEQRPDLIVIGSHGRSALGRLWFGSVSQQVASEAYYTVRVARDGNKAPDEPAMIIIGVDGSPGSAAACREVARRSWPAKSKVRLVTSISLFPSDSGIHSLSDIEELHRLAADELRSHGLLTSTSIRDDAPKHGLIAEAERWKADSIFVGARGMSRFKRFLLGGVSTAVVSRAHCSVEVVRSPENS